MVETIPLNIRTPKPLTNIKINVQCSDKDEMGSTRLLGESQKVFAWFYEDLHGFDPSLVQHTMELASKNKNLLTLHWKHPFKRS